MTSHRERKRLRTRTAIHKAAMGLFAQHGFAETTIADIAQAADVSRATFFSYYAGKDDVVFGAAPEAVAQLGALLQDPPDGALPAIRAWLGGLSGWLDDEDLPLQMRLVREVPSVAARRLLLGRQIEDLIEAALRRELRGRDARLVARLAAASIVAAFGAAEMTAADRTAQRGRRLSPAALDRLLDTAVEFVEGGLDRLDARRPAPAPARAPRRASPASGAR